MGLKGKTGLIDPVVKKVSERLREKPRSRGYNRNKGHNFERQCAGDLKQIFPRVRRQLEYHSEDANGVDLMNTGIYRFQCKSTKKYVSINTIKEVKADLEQGEVPVLIAAADDEETMAVLPWWYLRELIKQAEGK